MIKGSSFSKIIILFPQNIDFIYEAWNDVYHEKTNVKDMLKDLMKNILIKLYQPLGNCELLYENTKTDIESKDYEAAFYFNTEENIILKSKKSNKPTVVKIGKVIGTTLKIEDGNELMFFLGKIGALESKQFRVGLKK